MCWYWSDPDGTSGEIPMDIAQELERHSRDGIDRCFIALNGRLCLVDLLTLRMVFRRGDNPNHTRTLDRRSDNAR